MSITPNRICVRNNHNSHHPHINSTSVVCLGVRSHNASHFKVLNNGEVEETLADVECVAEGDAVMMMSGERKFQFEKPLQIISVLARQKSVMYTYIATLTLVVKWVRARISTRTHRTHGRSHFPFASRDILFL